MDPKMQETSEVFVSAAAECNVYAGVGGMNANHMPVAAVTKGCLCLCLEVEVEEGGLVTALTEEQLKMRMPGDDERQSA